MAKIEVRETEGGNVVRDVPVRTREFAIIDDPVHDRTERAKIREAAQEWILENYQTNLPYHGDLLKVDYATLQAAVQELREVYPQQPDPHEWIRNVSFGEVRGGRLVTPKYDPLVPGSDEISLHDIPGVIAEGLVNPPSGSVDWLAEKEIIYRLVPIADSPIGKNVRKVLSVLSLCKFPASSIRAGYHPQRSSYMIWVHATGTDFILIKCYSDRIQIGDYFVRTK